MSNVEQRDFRISNNMIYHLVFSQAGTIAKGLCELYMNAEDAGSPDFKVEINNTGFKVVDAGRGFKTQKEIEDWFEELGFDHSVDDLHKEEGRFSRFGLGRAQIMAFGSTSWHTNSFRMDVDIKEKGIGYELLKGQPQVDGCTIEGTWYEPLSFADLRTVEREFEELVAYARIPIEVNGTVINDKKAKWDYETDKVFIRRRETGGLAVYNQGVLVRTYPAYQLGSGIVVSKVPLALNVARNDVLVSTCGVWKEVRAFLREDAVSTSKRKTRLNDDERQLLVDQLLSGEISYDEVRASPLVEDVTGRKWSLDRIVDKTLTVHTQGTKLAADRVQQSKQAFVLAKKVMESFSADSPEQLINKLESIYNSSPQWCERQLTYIPIADLINSNNDEFTILKEKELTKTERVALTAIKCGFSNLHSAVQHATGNQMMPRRELFIGVSEHAHAWTDGSRFIAIDRKFLREHIRDGFRGFTTICNVLVHELCHESNTATGHEHGAEFYEAFHDVLCGQQSLSYGTAIRLMMANFLKRAQKEGLKLTRNELKDLDREVELERDVYETTDMLDLVGA